MLKFLSRVRIEFNALDPRMAASMEFLAQCNACKAKESNPACQVVVKRRTEDHPPQITEYKVALCQPEAGAVVVDSFCRKCYFTKLPTNDLNRMLQHSWLST
ncbi:hypothetical protein RJ640_000901 [Escallonia rubra]|uniref:Large ribosomal subunit protein mL53 n=1 Tax=Escallonia rubra TaxID=112253 RepID=A0AA88RGK6_9ASTE|nr:hypothetical protein RJ640_000901 [Escallonia rubra]